MAMICGVVPVATARVDFNGLAVEFWVVVWVRGSNRLAWDVVVVGGMSEHCKSDGCECVV